MTRTEFRFSGFGGQGVITMAHIVGRAATLGADMDATMTEAYGPEKTGGFSRGDVVVSDTQIDYPAVVDPDVVVAFSQDAFERDADSVVDDGVVLVERDLVDAGSFGDDRPSVTIHEVPAVETAEGLGQKVVANIVMLGAVVDLVGTPPLDVVRRTVGEVVPEGTGDMNEQAFERGTSSLTQEVVR